METARGTPTRHLREEGLVAAIETAQREENAHLLRRLCFVRNRYAGDSITEAGRRVGVSSATASRWARRWEADGVDGLRRAPRSGRPPALDGRDRDAIAEALEQRSRWTVEEVRRLIGWGFDVTYSSRHVYRIVDELGMDGRLGRIQPEQEDAGDPLEDDAVRGALDAVRRPDDAASGET